MADHFFIMDVIEETFDGSIDYATMTNTRKVHFYDLSQDKDTFFNETQAFFTPFEGVPEPVIIAPGPGTGGTGGITETIYSRNPTFRKNRKSFVFIMKE